MFVYLSKKIAIPHGLRLTSVSWNNEQSWIACGGGNGLLKVLKLDSSITNNKQIQLDDNTVDKKNISQNQTLEGHNGNLRCIVWNELYQKLTSVDQYGMIIVWMLHKGLWYEEMINNRNKSTVSDMRWSVDGTKICIIYVDGAVIVGSVDGNRLWGKELEVGLTLVEWSPNGQYLLFGTDSNEIHIYDCAGNYITRLTIYINTEFKHKLVGIQWYSGINGYSNTLTHNNQLTPCLAIIFENGEIQLNTSEIDDYPVLIDCSMSVTTAKWNHNGSVLAVAGIKSIQLDTVDNGSIEPANNIKQQHLLMLFNNHGKHIRTLKVPGSGINSITWEGCNLRLALAVDSYIYFVNVRPTYTYTYMKDENTLVYAYNKPDRTEQCITFWDIHNDTKTMKYIKDLIQLYSHKQYICFVTRNTDESQPDATQLQYALILCNTIGNPINSKYIDFRPVYGCMSQHYILVCNDRYIYAWQYKMNTSNVKQRKMSVVSQLTEQQYMYHIDTMQCDLYTEYTTQQALQHQINIINQQNIHDPIVACTMFTNTDQCLIARASGLLIQCKLSTQHGLVIQSTYNVQFLVHELYNNCDNTRLAIIDSSGSLTLYTYDYDCDHNKYQLNIVNGFSKSDVWQFVWSTDNSLLYTYTEKNKMYIMRDTTPEEPIQSMNYVLQYNELTIQTINLDELYDEPDTTVLSLITTCETKSLRDTRQLLLAGDINTNEIIQFIQHNSHNKLWRLLGDYCLQKSDFTTASMCYVYINDYVTIQYIHKLQLIQNPIQQQCEISIYFKQFDQAEQLYIDHMMYSNAIELRKRLGDWFRVLQLIQQYSIHSEPQLVTQAYNEIGDYYYERRKYNKSLKFYQKSMNILQCAQCAYKLDDYITLQQLISQTDQSDVLQQLGQMFASVGLCSNAVECYIKSNQYTLAIQCCIQLNEWNTAIELAHKYNYTDINTLFDSYATHLQSNQQYTQCITLYQNCHKHQLAAKLMLQLHNDTIKQNSINIDHLNQKKLYLCIVHELEKYNKLQYNNTNTNNTANNLNKLTSLLSLDNTNQLNDDISIPDLSDMWQHVEAYHYYNLCMKQLHSQQYQSAYNTAVRLTQYDTVIDSQHVYNLLCICSLYCEYYGTASHALIQLESYNDITPQQREQYKQLSVAIFITNHPVNPEPNDTIQCINSKEKCTGRVDDSTIQCDTCGKQYTACMASGRSLLTNESNDIYTCSVCQHKAYNSEINGIYKYCPMCHTTIQ